MKRIVVLMLTALLIAAFAACGAKPEPSPAPLSELFETEAPTAEPEQPAETEAPESKIDLPDGVYAAEFKTDGSMFHVNEAHHGKGVLTVKDGKATIHITLPSKNTVNLFYGTKGIYPIR